MSDKRNLESAEASSLSPTEEGVRPGLEIMPLGGCGEVGLNCTLLIKEQQSLLIDCGLLLSLPDAPGVDCAIPDFSPLHAIAGAIQGLVLTHGHEDHIGAIDKFLDEFDVQVYGPPLAISLVRSRLEGQKKKLKKLHEIHFGQTEKLGQFEIEWIRVTHSIPDSAALFIQTDAGNLVHTGDFKLDPDPIDGHVTDLERLKSIGDAGVDVLLSDSTNSERSGCTESETKVGLALEREIISAKKRVLVTCFSSHFHRIQSIANAAEKANRKIVIVGRALQGAWTRGAQEGYLKIPPEISVPAKFYETLPAAEVLILASGTQGESRSAVARLAQEKDVNIQLEAGDCFIRSAMTIPGNTLPYRRVVNAFARRGIEVIDDRGSGLHCSGHAHSEEQREMLNTLKPKCFVPIHGERTMLEAHGRIAIEAGVLEEQVLIVEDGQSVVFQNGRIERSRTVEIAPIFVDGVSKEIISWDSVGKRRKVGFGGMVVCSLIIDARSGQPRGQPVIEMAGIPEHKGLLARLSHEVYRAHQKQHWPPSESREMGTKRLILKGLKKTLGVRPLVFVHIHED